MESVAKFSVGEQVIVISKHYPEINGEYVVLEVINEEVYTKMYPTFENGCFFYYDLGVSVTGNRCGNKCSHIAETTLRKKHTPSSESFLEIMTGLKRPQKV